MSARMTEKEYASFLASRYIPPWKKEDDVDAGPFQNGLDEHDVLRLFKQQHELRETIYRSNLQMWIGFTALAALMCYLHG